ncbi:hypothetical protein ACFOSC_19340 [Streptantibioticus rubrisoli]|uniref:Uncharacterized protein n=1 Tax=Streptantibioticus rubrisoli TaxID=1387313 RepID=A0ABT1PJC2_9ACTN|nr:hypothetical protein [Streptantibioticus rubrisoli]MCQ4045455.1 hypothetical protein [Streptantibioticus rubrisoli]
MLKVQGSDHLFWRAMGYVPARIAVWIYVPLNAADVDHLDNCSPADLLEGLIFDSHRERYVTVGVAEDNRLFFEREWLLPGGHGRPQLRKELLRFLLEALMLARDQDLPLSRREIVDRASQAVHELAISGS